MPGDPDDCGADKERCYQAPRALFDLTQPCAAKVFHLTPLARSTVHHSQTPAASARIRRGNAAPLWALKTCYEDPILRLCLLLGTQPGPSMSRQILGEHPRQKARSFVRDISATAQQGPRATPHSHDAVESDPRMAPPRFLARRHPSMGTTGTTGLLCLAVFSSAGRFAAGFSPSGAIRWAGSRTLLGEQTRRQIGVKAPRKGKKTELRAVTKPVCSLHTHRQLATALLRTPCDSSPKSSSPPRG